MPSFSFIPLMVSEEKIFKHFYENWPFLPPPGQPIRFTNLDKSRTKRRGLLNKHFCEKWKIQISPMRQKKLSISSFSHYKSMGTISCHSNQSSYPSGIKNTTFRSPPTYRCYMWNMRRIGLTASEEMSFENVDRRDDGRTTDTFIYYKLTNEPSAQVS